MGRDLGRAKAAESPGRMKRSVNIGRGHVGDTPGSAALFFAAFIVKRSALVVK